MFTGIIEEVGRVESSKLAGKDFKLLIRGPEVSADLNIGDSIAVNGVCLTVTVLKNGGVFEADVMPETMRASNLIELIPGSLVNLERAMKAGGRFGGHFVSGHVDGTINLLYKRPENNAIIMGFSTAPENLRYIVKKGSVAIDGVSLTVASVFTEGFSVSVIPHTLEVTTLGRKKTGQLFNLEVDILGKYVEKYLGKYIEEKGEGEKRVLTVEYLREKGF